MPPKGGGPAAQWRQDQTPWACQPFGLQQVQAGREAARSIDSLR